MRGDRVAHHVDETCLRNNLCHPLGDAAVDVRPRITWRALSNCSGTVGTLKERPVPATAAGPVLLSYEEVQLAGRLAAPNEDVGMVIEVVTKADGPCLHGPYHHESRQGHCVVTATDVLHSSPGSVLNTHSLPDGPGARRNILRPDAHPQPREPTVPAGMHPDLSGSAAQQRQRGGQRACCRR